MTQYMRAELGLSSSLWLGHCLGLKLNGRRRITLVRPPAMSEQLVPSGVCQGWGWAWVVERWRGPRRAQDSCVLLGVGCPPGSTLSAHGHLPIFCALSHCFS